MATPDDMHGVQDPTGRVQWLLDVVLFLGRLESRLGRGRLFVLALGVGAMCGLGTRYLGRDSWTWSSACAPCWR